MSKIIEIGSSSPLAGVAPVDVCQALPEWLALYTSTRHEKKVAEQLAIRQIESFLPLYTSLRSWKNGCKVKVELPLFPNYVFVRVGRQERVRALEIPGVLSFVGIGNRPASLPDAEIQALRSGIQMLKCEPHPYLVIGERVRIKNGPLSDFEGVLLRKKGAVRVVISLEMIMKSVAIEVDVTDVEPVGIKVNRPLRA